VDDAKAFHKKLLESGLWTRVHAYHEGHSTVLTKLGFLADEAIVDFVLSRFRELLATSATKGPAPVKKESVVLANPR
jgi:hypothetical protein